MRVYFVRHGESVLNTTEELGDIPVDHDRLSELGQRQAEQLGQRLKNEGLTHLIVSPLRRAQETAAGINKTLKLPSEEHSDIYEYRQPSRLYTVPLIDRLQLYASVWMPEHDDDPDYQMEDAESFNQLVGRVDRFLRHLETQDPQRNLLVVTHRNFLGMLSFRILLGDELRPRHMRRVFNSLGSANTGISILEYDPDYTWKEHQAVPGWNLATWMDHAHL